MAAHVLRLRLDLLLGSLRGHRGHVIRTLAGFVVLVALTAVACWALLRLQDARLDVATTVTVLAGSAVTLAFFAAPLVVGLDDPLDPRRFAVFGVTPNRVAGVLLLASVVSIPILALIAVGVCLAMVWMAHDVPASLAIAGAVVAVVTCILCAKVSAAIASLVLRERRSRELTGLFLVAVLVILVPAGVFFASLEWRGRVPSQVAEAVDILALTPVGAATAFPRRLAEGEGTASLLIALATMLVLVAVWFMLVRALLTTTERPSSGRERPGLGWFTVMPGTPTGAIAARSVTYWLRDARYLVNLVVVPIAAVVAIVPLLVVGVPLQTAVLLPAPLMALFFGWLAHNDLAYDSTAVWMHVAAAVRGTADRAGRLVPLLLVAVPVLAISVTVSVWLHERWALLPAMTGVCASLFLCGLGLSSVSSVVAPYPVSRPGDSPFQQPQRTGGGLMQGVVLVGALALSAPALWWAWRAISQDPDNAWQAFWGGLAIGLVVLVLGILIGGWVFRRRGSRIMEFAEAA